MANTTSTTTAFDRAATQAAIFGAPAQVCYIAPLKTAVTVSKNTTLAECLLAECTDAGPRVPAGFTVGGGVCTTVAAKFTATAPTDIVGYFVATESGMLIALTMLETPRHLNVGDNDTYTVAVE